MVSPEKVETSRSLIGENGETGSNNNLYVKDLNKSSSIISIKNNFDYSSVIHNAPQDLNQVSIIKNSNKSSDSDHKSKSDK